MSDKIASLKCVDTHEWVKFDDSGEIVVGITDYAQDLLGDIVFAGLPKIGQRFSAKEEVMLLESVKASSDVYMPVNGVILAVNTELEDSPELINEDPFGEGWLFKFEADNSLDIEGLLSAEEYESSLND